MTVREKPDTQTAFYSINMDFIESYELFSINNKRTLYLDSEINEIKFTFENRKANANDPSI